MAIKKTPAKAIDLTKKCEINNITILPFVIIRDNDGNNGDIWSQCDSEPNMENEIDTDPDPNSVEVYSVYKLVGIYKTEYKPKVIKLA